MHGAHEFLAALATVLCVAALTTVVFQRLHQPVVLGYLLAGLVVGPHVPIPLVADREIVQTLSELGVIFLMFSLGLEFSLRTLFRVGPTAGLTAVLQCSVMLGLGYAVASRSRSASPRSLRSAVACMPSSRTRSANRLECSSGGRKGCLRIRARRTACASAPRQLRASRVSCVTSYGGCSKPAVAPIEWRWEI